MSRNLRSLSVSFCFFLFLPGSSSAAFGPRKEFGILLLIENADAGSIRKAADELKDVAKKYPLEIALSSVDSGDLQKRVDNLQTAGAQKIVAVPLYVSLRSDEVEQARYLLRFSSAPSKGLTSMPHALWTGVKPVDSKVPIVMADALDASPAFASALAAQAGSSAGHAADQTLVLVGCQPGVKDGAAAWQAEIEGLCDAVRRAGSVKGARGFGLDCLSAPSAGGANEKALRQFVAAVRPMSSAVVVALEVNPGAASLKIPGILNGLFYRKSRGAVLSGPDLARWVSETATRAAAKPDERVKTKTDHQPFHQPESSSY